VEEDEYKSVKSAIETALATMISWEVKHKAVLKGGSKILFRNGDLMGQSMWFVMLECLTDNEEALKDLPPKEEWEDSVFATVSEQGVILMFWIFTHYDEMVTEMAKLFGLFMPKAN
jgi:hypothetical protein